ncbi:MAG: ABC transporter ATP-binding protein, partial [Ilumatobacter sp.]
ANSRALRRQSFVAFLFTPMYATVLLLLLVGALGAIRASGTGDLASLGAVMVMMIRSLAYAQLAQAVYGTLQASQPYLADLSEQLDAYRSDAVDRSGIDSADFEFVEFRDVGFSYSPDGFGLTDVNFRVDVGESIGIIGPSGSGKSTLVQLLLRLRTPTSGSIFASGVPANEIAIDGWRRRVAFVPQDAKLINGTISDNIRFFRPEIPPERIEAAARAANIHDEIVALQGGYEAVVGGTDLHLSGGQRQRICIARALATDPDLLVLDEPTSALDARSEARIRETLHALRADAAVVIIAHRLSTLDSCDRIMVVQDGRIVAFDRREVLEQSSEFYREVLELSGLVPAGSHRA